MELRRDWQIPGIRRGAHLLGQRPGGSLRAGMLVGFALLLLAPLGAAELEIRVIYDNTSISEETPADWGFSALITFRGRRVLFDSGTKPELFLANLKAMDVDPKSIEHVVISHEHPDHRNGVYALYPLNPDVTVHFLDVFPNEAFEEARAVGMSPERVTTPTEILPGIYTTGMIDGEVREQSLIIETSKGPVVLVGCSHPGLVKIVDTVRRQRGAETIRLLAGGYHMLPFSDAQILRQLQDLQGMGVREVMPAHCSGDRAHAIFAREYGEKYQTLGAGRVVTLE